MRGAVLAAPLLLAGCSDPPAAPAAPALRPAKLVEAYAQDHRATVVLPAVFEASATVELAFQSAGRVVEIDVREGDSVSAGTAVARLDQREIRNDLAAAEARHDAAVSEFDRVDRLVADGAVSRALHDQRRTAREVARTALEAARRRLDDSVLRAPFAGVIAAVHIEAYQSVVPQAPVATLQSEGAAEAIVHAPATLIANSPRIETIDTVVLLDAAPGLALPGTLHSLSARADPTGQTFEARIAFEPPEDLVVQPGMTGTVRSTLVAPDAPPSVGVPIGAVFSEGGAEFVWVVDRDSMEVARRRVTVGEGVGATLPVVAGLEPGETVVAAGVSFLREGMRVRRHEP